MEVNTPRFQGSWSQHGAHLGPVGPSWAPCWPHKPLPVKFLLVCMWQNQSWLRTMPSYDVSWPQWGKGLEENIHTLVMIVKICEMLWHILIISDEIITKNRTLGRLWYMFGRLLWIDMTNFAYRSIPENSNHCLQHNATVTQMHTWKISCGVEFIQNFSAVVFPWSVRRLRIKNVALSLRHTHQQNSMNKVI